MTLHLLTLDFRHAPLALREQVAFSDHTLPAALAALRARAVPEAAILSTCNRVELITSLGADEDGRQTLLTFLSEWHGIAPPRLADHACHLVDDAAARHLVRVACGLESLVPGEMQILGQVRQAAAVAREAGMLGPNLTRLFDFAVAAGRRARHETGIARRPVSLSHAAVVRIQAHFGDDLRGRCVLLIGSGKMGEVAAQQLHKAGASHFMIANRTLARACELAQRWGGVALPLDQMPTALAEVDAVIAATSAPHPILRAAHLRAAMQGRPDRPLLVIDLAVPRDVEPAAADVPGVTLCDVDGLQEVVAQNIALRNEEREAVRGIVDEEVARYRAECAARAVAPTIVGLRTAADAIRQAELDKALRRLRHLSDDERAVVEAFSRSLMNKFLHEPTVQLRQKAATDERDLFQRAVAELFALPEGEA